jgi:hypothetical protein
MSVVPAWLRGHWSNRAPAGYRPGVLISKVRLDLRDLESDVVSDTCVRFRSAADTDLVFLAEEQVESQFLMHVVTTRFSCRIAGNSNPQHRLRIRHCGAWKRTGIECTFDNAAGNACQDLARRLAQDADLASAMLPLDFTNCELLPAPGGWDVRIVHFGASEVVYRLPPIRQYVRLSREQAKALLQTFTVLKVLLGSSTQPHR